MYRLSVPVRNGMVQKVGKETILDLLRRMGAERVFLSIDTYVTDRAERARELEMLEPFGQGNEKPQFAQKSVHIKSARVLGKNRNAVKLSMVTPSGKPADGILFTEGDRFLEEMGTRRDMDVIYYPGINEYNGNRTIQMVVKEWKFS